MVGSYFLMHSHDLCLLMDIFRYFTLNEIIGMFGLRL